MNTVAVYQRENCNKHVECLSDSCKLSTPDRFPASLVYIYGVPHLASGQVSPLHEWVTNVVLMDILPFDTAICLALHAPTPLMEPQSVWVVVHCRNGLEYSCNIPCICGDRV